MEVHFISDLHLDPAQPELGEIFLRYLEQRAPAARQLYILGDLFEVWAGDDVSADLYPRELSALQALAQGGTAIGFIAGNRDFLCGPEFCRRSGASLVQEPLIIRLPDKSRAVLLHGDVLCTDDRSYQLFRRLVRNRLVQAAYFRLPRRWRARLVRRIRSDASRVTQSKKPLIMDVNRDAVDRCFEAHDVECIIHGHTHRPATHECGAGRERIVLADWSVERGEVLIADAAGLRRETLN